MSQTKPKAKVVGENGNVFNIMGIVGNVLKQNGQREKKEEMVKKVMSSDSYDKALSIMQEYVEFI